MTFIHQRCRAVTLAGVLTFFMFASKGMPAEKPECRRHELDAAKVKERLRHWRGLAAFSRWRLVEVRPAECVVDGKVKSRLVLAPPSGWSRYRVPYLVQADLDLDPERQAPAGAPSAEFSALAKGVRRLVLRAEADEDVRRFIERFPPDRAEIDSADGSGKLRVTFVYSPGKDGGRGHPVRLTFSEAFDDGKIVAYDLPRVDSLPVRRELLSFAGEISARIPHCQPSWISARFRLLPDKAEDQAGRWKIAARLSGKKCPEKFELALEFDSSHDRWLPIDATPAKSHGGN